MVECADTQFAFIIYLQGLIEYNSKHTVSSIYQSVLSAKESLKGVLVPLELGYRQL